MKKNYLLILLVFISLCTKAQTWDSVGSGVNWEVFSFAVYKGELYVGGEFTEAGGVPVNFIAKWNGTTWDSVGSGMSVVNYLGTEVYSLAVYNSELYGSGTYQDSIGYIVYWFAKWNGTDWDTFANQMYLQVTALYPYNGELYGIVDGGVAEWNGTNWIKLVGNNGGGTEVYSLAVYNGELFEGGGDVVEKWNGTNWDSVGTMNYNGVYSLAVYNGELYASGDFTEAGGVPANGIAKWNGTTWDSVSTGIYSQVSIIDTLEGGLFAEGIYIGNGLGCGYGYLIKWNGTTWDSVGTNIGGIYSLAVYNGALYAGGDIIGAGCADIFYIAKLDGISGINYFSTNYGISVFPNPSYDKFTISFQNPIPESELEIYNVLGERIYLTPLNSDKTEIDLSGEAKGIYFYRITTSANFIADGKLIIQ